MKKITLISILTLACVYSFCQTKDSSVDAYFNTFRSNVHPTLNHGPIDFLLKTNKEASLFFIRVFDSVQDSLSLEGVVQIKGSNIIETFYISDFEPYFCKGVITVIFENVDSDPEKELLFIVENSNRTFYSDGGYAGIKPTYSTRVFNINLNQNTIKFSEYRAIGELLTVNAPLRMGSKAEEQIIGREALLLDNVLGVTKNADALKRRIKTMKANGLLQ